MSEWVECTFEEHGVAILEILNYQIENTTALYDTEPRSLASMKSWFATKLSHSYPVIGLLSDTQELIGFATYASFRPHAAYSKTIEHSVYVKTDYSGNGYGFCLLEKIIDRARAQGFHTMIGVIDSDNLPSIKLHQKLGFSCSGTLKEVGFKFDRWLNVDLYQLHL